MKKTLFAAFALLAPSATAYSADLATGDQILEAVSGNTVQGGMDASGAYTEYYAADGVVHGQDYEAEWSIEGDTMCWVYDGSPKDCWNASVSGDQVSWIKDGETQGTGTILPGNPNNF